MAISITPKPAHKKQVSMKTLVSQPHSL